MNLILTLLLFLPIINQSIPEGAFLYPGSHPREVILVDPENSRLLEKAYEGLQLELSESFSEYEILKVTSLYVREVLFNLDLCNESNVRSLIHSLHPNEEQPQISLEVFLKEKTGVCRHTALTSTYLVNRLIKDGRLRGKAFLIRAETPGGRHAWTLFLSDEGAWHLDSLWDVLENGKTSAGFSKLCHKYGKRTMDGQKERWENDKNNFL